MCIVVIVSELCFFFCSGQHWLDLLIFWSPLLLVLRSVCPVAYFRRHPLMHRLKLLFLMRWNQILWIVCLKSIFILLSISETTIIVFYSCWVISRAISFYRCVNSTNTTWYPKYCWAIDLQFSRFGSYWTILDTTSCLHLGCDWYSK